MTPEAYKSQWCSKTHFLTKTIIRSDVVFAVVADGVQAYEGNIFPTQREAKQWLKDNGFEKRDK